MKDSLKNFISEHRDEFDDKKPKDHVWNRIERHIPGKSVSLWSNIQVWRAAAIVLLTLSTYLLISINYNQPMPADKAALQGEFMDLEKFYNGQIADKVELISTIQEFKDDESFAQDLEKLDAMYQVLREQMKTHPSEKVKDALILNMLVRIDLLNQQIKNLEDTDKKSEEVSI